MPCKWSTHLLSDTNHKSRCLRYLNNPFIAMLCTCVFKVSLSSVSEEYYRNLAVVWRASPFIFYIYFDSNTRFQFGSISQAHFAHYLPRSLEKCDLQSCKIPFFKFFFLITWELRLQCTVTFFHQWTGVDTLLSWCERNSKCCKISQLA